MTSSPIYLRIADDLRQKIRSGEYPPGAKLPSTDDLTSTYGVSQATVRGAMRLLRDEGLVDVPGPGRPTMVRVPPERIIRDATSRYHIEKDLALKDGLPADTHLAREVGAADEEAEVWLAGRDTIPAAGEIGWTLGLDENERIHQYTWVIGVKGRQVERIAYHYFPAWLDNLVAETHPRNAVEPGSVIWRGGTFKGMATVGKEPMRVRERVTARKPLPEERAWMPHLPDDVDLLVIRKITFDSDGTAQEVVDVLMPADRSEAWYEIDLPPWPAGWRNALHDDSDVD